MKVGFDTSPLRQTRAGTGRYVAELTAELERDPEIDLNAYALGGGGRVTAALRDAAWYPAVLPVQARRVDVLHCPTFRAPFRSSAPLVVTFHDVAVLRRPEFFNRWTRRYSAFALPRVARAAARIITGSEFTRGELIDVLRVPEEKIRLVRYGVNPPFRPEGPASEGEFVLAVSTLEPRKNLVRLVEGFAQADLDGVELRVVGARGWGDVRVAGQRVRWLGEVSDDELARLYRGARCAAYVSLYEGFGLPVLEAMACGVPVVTSGLRPFHEFAEGASVPVDPNDPEAIAAGIAEAISRRDELGARGAEQARAFDWQTAARETVDVYREVV
jgi:glycosyltransferase involved in cell wall biosynthesis